MLYAVFEILEMVDMEELLLMIKWLFVMKL